MLAFAIMPLGFYQTHFIFDVGNTVALAAFHPVHLEAGDSRYDQMQSDETEAAEE